MYRLWPLHISPKRCKTGSKLVKFKLKLKTNLYSAIKSGDSEALDGIATWASNDSLESRITPSDFSFDDSVRLASATATVLTVDVARS